MAKVAKLCLAKTTETCLVCLGFRSLDDWKKLEGESIDTIRA